MTLTTGASFLPSFPPFSTYPMHQTHSLDIVIVGHCHMNGTSRSLVKHIVENLNASPKRSLNHQELYELCQNSALTVWFHIYPVYPLVPVQNQTHADPQHPSTPMGYEAGKPRGSPEAVKPEQLRTLRLNPLVWCRSKVWHLKTLFWIRGLDKGGMHSTPGLGFPKSTLVEHGRATF